MEPRPLSEKRWSMRWHVTDLRRSMSTSTTSSSDGAPRLINEEWMLTDPRLHARAEMPGSGCVCGSGTEALAAYRLAACGKSGQQQTSASRILRDEALYDIQRSADRNGKARAGT